MTPPRRPRPSIGPRPVVLSLSAVHTPAGYPAVLLQLEAGWITLAPPDARQLAALLTTTAEAAEQLGPEP